MKVHGLLLSAGSCFLPRPILRLVLALVSLCLALHVCLCTYNQVSCTFVCVCTRHAQVKWGRRLAADPSARHPSHHHTDTTTGHTSGPSHGTRHEPASRHDTISHERYPPHGGVDAPQSQAAPYARTEHWAHAHGPRMDQQSRGAEDNRAKQGDGAPGSEADGGAQSGALGARQRFMQRDKQR